MRILVFFVGFLVLLFGGSYFLLFSQSGNNIVKPYLESYVSEKLQKEVKITHFTLKTNHLSLRAEVPNEASLLVDGAIKIFQKSFDLLYQCEAQNLQTPIVLIREKLEIRGKATGSIDDFMASGRGKAFSSNINFDLHVVNKIPLDGHIDAKGISIAQVLDFIGKPRYSAGKVDIVADVQNKSGSIEGEINTLIQEGALNEKLISRDFNLTLPKNITYMGKVDGNIKEDILHVKSDLASSILALKTTNTQLNIKTNNLESDFVLDIPSLVELEPITKKKLHGKVKVDGSIKKEGNKIALNAKSNIFGGELGATYENDNLKATLKNANIKHILAMLGESAYAYGDLQVNADFKKVSKKDRSGSVEIKAEKGELVGSATLRKQTGLNLPPVTQFGANIKIALKNSVLEAQSDIKTTLANLKTNKTVINLETKNLASDFDIDIGNLSHIGRLLEQELQGKLNVNGNAGFENELLTLKANTRSLGGIVDIKLDKENLNFNLKDVLAAKVAHIAKKDGIIVGNLDASATLLNIKSDNLSGKIDYELKNGELLGRGLKALTDINFPPSTPLSLKGGANIKDGFAKFTNTLSSSLANIKHFNGTYSIPKKTLDSNYALDVKDLSKFEFLTGKKLHGQLQGDGEVKMDKEALHVSMNAPFLGGQSATLFNKNILTAKATQISIKGLSELLDIPYVFSSNGDFNLTYNTTSKKGNYNLLMKDGKMVKNQLSDLVFAFSGYDLLKEVYKDTILKGAINNDNVSYLLNMQGQQTSVHIPNGTLSLASKQTSADFDLKFQKTDIKGEIKGDISSPKVSIKASQYLQQKATDALEKHLPKEHQGIVKDVLKLFN